MRLILQLCLLLFVLLSTETHAWGKMVAGQNIASGGYGIVYVDCTSPDAPPTLINAGEAGPSDYELASDVRDGPNVYAYVKQNPWTGFDPHGLADRVDDDGFKWSSNDHHVVPREVARDAGWNKEAKEVFDRAKISTEGVGHGNTAHPRYNQEVAAEMGDFLKAEGVTDIGSAKNQRELAERLVERLSKTENAYIKGFNSVVAQGPEAVKAWSDSVGRGIILKSTGRIAAEGGQIVNGIAHMGAKGGRFIARGVPLVGGIVVGAAALMGGASNAEAAAEVLANSTVVGGFALDASHLREISGLQKTAIEYRNDPNFYLPKDTGTAAGDSISGYLNERKRLLQQLQDGPE